MDRNYLSSSPAGFANSAGRQQTLGAEAALGPVEKRDRSPIETALSHQSSICTELSSLVDRLTERLEPVLDQVPSSEKVREPMQTPGNSLLSAAITNNNEHLLGTIMRLRVVLDRLAV